MARLDDLLTEPSARPRTKRVIDYAPAGDVWAPTPAVTQPTTEIDVSGMWGSTSPGQAPSAPAAPTTPAPNADPWASFYNTPIFNDPATIPLEQFIKDRFPQLTAPINDPSQQAYTDLVKQLSGQWANAGPAAHIGNLTTVRGLGEIPGLTSVTPTSVMAQMQTGATNELSPEAIAYARQYIGQLQETPFSAGDEATMRAALFNGIEADRKAATDRALEQAGARGLSASSGPVSDLLMQVNQSADKNRAAAQNQLMLTQMAEKQRRLQEAMNVANTLQGWGGQNAGLELQSQGLGLQAQNQAQQAQFQSTAEQQQQAMAQFQTALAAAQAGQQGDVARFNSELALEQARANTSLQAQQQAAALQAMGLNAAGDLVNVNRQNRAEENANQALAGNYLSSLSELARQRNLDANNVLNANSNPAQLTQQLMQLLGLNQQQSQYNDAQTQQQMSGLSALLAYLAQQA